MTSEELNEFLFRLVPDFYKDYPGVLDIGRDALLKTIEEHPEELRDNFANLLWLSVEKECVDLTNKGLIDMAVDKNGEVVFQKKRD